MNDQLIDEKKILFEFSDDFDIFTELVDDYKEGCITMIQAIEDALKSQDSASLRITAHTLKGVSSNFYAPALKEVVFTLEKKGEEQDFSNTEELFNQLKLVNTIVVKELSVFIERNSSLLDTL